MYTLVVLGMPRTGTSSIWKFLRNHPQISVCKIKEPVWNWDKNPDTYLDLYDLNEDTKVLADCSPILETKFKLEAYNNLKVIDRFCCLYTLRCPFARVNSWMNYILKAFFAKRERWIRRGFKRPPYLDKNEQFMKHILFYYYCQRLREYNIIKEAEQLFTRQNLFITLLSKFDQRGLWKFLNVDDSYEFAFPHETNRIGYENARGYGVYLKMKDEFDSWLESNMDKLSKIKEENCLKIEEEYGFKCDTE